MIKEMFNNFRSWLGFELLLLGIKVLPNNEKQVVAMAVRNAMVDQYIKTKSLL